MDNYYTRHTLGLAIQKFIDGEVSILGTINIIEATNKRNVLKAIKMLKDKEQGSWFLVAAYNRHPEHEKEQKKRAATTRHQRKE